MKQYKKNDGSYVIKENNGKISAHLPSRDARQAPETVNIPETVNPHTVEIADTVDEKFKNFIQSEHKFPTEHNYQTPLKELPAAYMLIEGEDPYKASSYEKIKNGAFMFELVKTDAQKEALVGFILSEEQYSTLYNGTDTPISAEKRAAEILELETVNKQLHGENDELNDKVLKVNAKTNWGTAVATSAGSAGGGLAGFGASISEIVSVGGWTSVGIGAVMFAAGAGFIAHPILKNRAAKKTEILNKIVKENDKRITKNEQKISWLKTQTITYEEIGRHAVKGQRLN